MTALSAGDQTPPYGGTGDTDLTYQFKNAENRWVKTVFLANREWRVTPHEIPTRMNPTIINIGEASDVIGDLTNWPVCYGDAPDGGWYECDKPLEGNKISIRSERTDIMHYHMWTIRAYNGINVLTPSRIDQSTVPAESIDTLFR